METIEILWQYVLTERSWFSWLWATNVEFTAKIISWGAGMFYYNTMFTDNTYNMHEVSTHQSWSFIHPEERWLFGESRSQWIFIIITIFASICWRKF